MRGGGGRPGARGGGASSGGVGAAIGLAGGSARGRESAAILILSKANGSASLLAPAGRGGTRQRLLPPRFTPRFALCRLVSFLDIDNPSSRLPAGADPPIMTQITARSSGEAVTAAGRGGQWGG